MANKTQGKVNKTEMSIIRWISVILDNEPLTRSHFTVNVTAEHKKDIIIIIIIVGLASIQCVVSPLAANNLQNSLSSASSVASSTMRLWYDKLFFIVAIQKV